MTGLLALTMIFPFTRKQLKNPFELVGRIDREISERGRRLVIGIQLEPDFETLSGALVIIEGNGKYLRGVRADSCSVAIPKTTTLMLKNLQLQEDLSLLDLNAVRTDLALLQQSIVANMKRDAGKYINRLLVTAISDPGFCQNSSKDLQISICDANLLAELTGISVVSDFALRDLAAGGNGQHLFALPAWLLFADRNQKIARKDRLLVIVRDQIQSIYLPASDGLDVELPDVKVWTSPGLSLLNQLTGWPSDKKAIAEYNVQGQLNTDFGDAIQAAIQNQEDFKFKEFEELTMADRIRTGIVVVTNQITSQIDGMGDTAKGIEIIVDCAPELVGTFVNQLIRKIGEEQVRNDLATQGHPGQIHAVLTAMLGAMSIDQMPANVPWITGAKSQRVLGRLTPGSPSNWRQLLCEMADFQPPAMRLRDAV